MKFLGKLGIDVKLLVAQIVNFGVLLWLLKKLLYKPIIKQIEKDEEKLRQAQFQKNEIQKQKEIFEKQQKQAKIDSKKKVKEIIKEAENIAQEIKERTQKEAKQEKQAVIKQIKARLIEIEDAKKPKQSK